MISEKHLALVTELKALLDKHQAQIQVAPVEDDNILEISLSIDKEEDLVIDAGYISMAITSQNLELFIEEK